MSTASRIIRHYASLIHWHDGLVNAAACYRTEKATGIEWSPEERIKLHEASRLVEQAKTIVNELYANRIGKAVTYDVRNGKWGAPSRK